MTKKPLFDTSIIISLAVSTVFYLFVNHLYNGTAAPLSDKEINSYISILDDTIKNSVIEDSFGEFDAQKMADKFTLFAKTDDGRPFYMANIMKLRDVPFYPEWMEFNGTVEEADWEYAKHLTPELIRVGGHPSYVSNAIPNAMNYGATADNDNWDQIALIRYPSRRAFFDMITSDAYIKAAPYKFISMGSVLLTPTHTSILPFNPLPDITFLLFFVLVVWNLIFMLIRSRKG